MMVFCKYHARAQNVHSSKLSTATCLFDQWACFLDVCEVAYYYNLLIKQQLAV